MKIRPVSPDNADILAAASGIFVILSKVYGLSPWSLGFIMEDLAQENSQYYLAEEGEQIVGFLATIEVMNEIEITNIAVLPAFQGQKVATKLLRSLPVNWQENSTAVSTDEAVTQVFLEVRASNAPAQALYRKFGFEVYRCRKNYYSNPREDALLMRWGN